MEKMNLELFNKIPDGAVISVGIVENSPDGVFMTNSRIGDLMYYIIKKGHGNDWTIYFGWIEWGIDKVKTNGDKLNNVEMRKKLFPCDNEVFILYRR